ncbi:hypothetical protein COF68_05435 [Bacillus toyonensis]|nr:hypothetical protein COF68_05435 [Bacillus toyonensis]
MSMTSKLEERKSRKWFACHMDDGVIASGNTLKELLNKFGKTNATCVHRGHYEFKQGNDLYAWTVWVYNSKAQMKANGFDIDDDERNTWYKDDEWDSI